MNNKRKIKKKIKVIINLKFKLKNFNTTQKSCDLKNSKTTLKEK